MKNHKVRRAGCFLFLSSMVGVLSVLPAKAELVAKLPQVMNPFFVTIAEGRLFVVENSCVAHIYKLADRDVSLVRTIGREGQGPGEFDFMYTIRVREGRLDAIASHKYVRYSLDGEYIDELKFLVPVFKGGIDRVGPNFLVGDYAFDPPSSAKTIRLYDGKFKLLREIGIWKDTQVFGKLNPAPNYQTFRVSGDRMYIVETSRETKVTVRDADGNVLEEIRLPLEPAKMTAALKSSIIKALKDSYGPDLSRWDRVEKMLVFSDYAPGLDWFDVADGMFIARTYRYRGDEVEFAFFDMAGKEIKRMFLPFTGRNSNGIPFCVHEGLFYYLKMNEADDTYELHALKAR